MSLGDYVTATSLAHARAKLNQAISPRCRERHWLYGCLCTQPLTDGESHTGMHIGEARYQGQKFPVQWAALNDEELIA